MYLCSFNPEIIIKNITLKRSYLLIIIVLLVLFLDQALKIWVKTNMEYGEYFTLLGFDWARIHFVENPGMAFGIELGGDYGKLALSLFRIGAVFFLIYYIGELIKMKVSFGLLVSFALILAGALGNILDSAFYGLIFSASEYHGGLAEFMPESGGYASFLHGKVVDMLHFPLFEGKFPEWLPRWGGQHFEFFRPVFNLADTSITVGVLNIILFQRSFFAVEEPENKSLDAAETTSDIVETNKIMTTIENGTKLSEEDVTTIDSVVTGVKPEGVPPENIDPHSPKE